MRQDADVVATATAVLAIRRETWSAVEAGFPQAPPAEAIPRIFLKRASWVPIGTVSFTVYFHADAVTLAAIGTRHLLAHARAQQFRNDYFDQSAELWGPGGELLAVTHQLVY